MLLSEKLIYKYVLEPTKENPVMESKVETPWLDEGVPLKEQFDHSVLLKTDDLIITEQIHPNGFHLLTIQQSGRITQLSNWPFDQIGDSNNFLVRALPKE